MSTLRTSSPAQRRRDVKQLLQPVVLAAKVLTGLRRQAKRGELDRLLIRAVTLAHLRQHQRCGGKVQLACPQRSGISLRLLKSTAVGKAHA